MRLTSRDTKLVKDVGLSHLLTRDQIIQLGYFGSVTRANTRLRGLVQSGLLRRLETPFYGQSLYMAGRIAPEVAGYKVGSLIESRTSSPRFIQHALSVTNVRIALLNKGATEWRFEQQLWRKFGKHEVRPDGLALTSSLPMFVEVDLGHVSADKYKAKLLAYQLLASSSNCSEYYPFEKFRLLTVTTGPSRARHLRRLHPADADFEFLTTTFQELGAASVGGWS